MRRPLKYLLVTTFALVGLCGSLLIGAGVWFYSGAEQSNVGDLAFENELTIPELLEPTIDEDGRKVFDLEFIEGEAELLPGKQTETWGLNQTYLAPTLRASRGDEVTVNVTNGLDEETTLHWHGMHLPAPMDGGPHQMIHPGETWSPEWTINQPAATLWFHPHLHGETARHVYKGAAGMFLLDDPEAGALEIPDEYGVDDIPLIIQDKRFKDDGSLEDGGGFLNNVGTLGDEILVNGTWSPYFEAQTELVRFRVLNASNARIYNLGFTDDREFSMIASDSGLLAAPLAMTRIQLSPGERAEIVVRIAPGDDVTLRSFKPDAGLDFFTRRVNGGDDTFDIIKIRAAEHLAASAPLPATLATLNLPDASETVETRRFDLSDNQKINGKAMDMERIDAVITVDTTEIWEIRNHDGVYHNFHVHLVHFAVLEIEGEAPPPHLQGWKDTLFLPPNSTAKIIARFEEHTDPEVPYMFHCHLLRHEDQGMMGQFIVIEPGTTPPDRIEVHEDGHRH